MSTARAFLIPGGLASPVPLNYVCAAYATAARWPEHHPYEYVANWMEVTEIQALQACALAVGAGLVTSVANGTLTPAGVALCSALEIPLWRQPYTSSPGSQPAGAPWPA